MPAAVLVLAGVGVLAGAALGILTMIIIGIRRGDRHHLASAAKSHPDELARRILVGVRYRSESSDGENR